jgi:hypothetical protein
MHNMVLFFLAVVLMFLLFNVSVRIGFDQGKNAWIKKMVDTGVITLKDNIIIPGQGTLPLKKKK